ncbi:zinc finger protein Xfin-like [Plodia interpunctella]|uniref:zinc finger protein Xfin-like n=1 Tax=Plodia interpunctella TaxID=58824 RepID=UPI002368C861|nr:zinc finger protein Xfin-like [Plodia interpunctella]
MPISCYRLVDLKCLQCDQSFSLFNELLNHISSIHSNNCFVCQECKKTFNKKKELQSHIKIDHKKQQLSCNKCRQCFANLAEYNKHKQSVHFARKCNLCLRTFSSDIKRLLHMKTEHVLDTKIECQFCNKTLNTKTAFLAHVSKCKTDVSKVLDKEKKSTVFDIRRNVACVLNMSTAVPFKFFLHQFRCFYCPKDFRDSDLLKEHTVLEHPHCDTRFRSLKLRNRKDGVRIKVDVSTLSCKLCFEPISDLDTLINHIITEHKAHYDKTVDNYIESYKLIKDNYPCPSCPEVFRQFGILLRHVSSCHSENKILCVHCGMSFRADPNLRAHINRHHKPYNHKCSSCDLGFATNEMLQRHRGKVHGTNIATCKICSEKFASKNVMRRHLINAHGVGHKCDFCGKLFGKHSVMEEHIRRLHLKEKNVNCPVCSERFFDATRLKVHMVKHVGERNFHCDICNKKFLWKKNLRVHMAMHVKNSNHNLIC